MNYSKLLGVICLGVLSFSSFAIEKDAISTHHAFPYIGISGGYGVIDRDAPSMRDFLSRFNSLADGGLPVDLITSILPIEQKSGGLSGRIYSGYIFDLVNSLSVGPEIGFTYYHKNTASQRFNFSFPEDEEGTSGSFGNINNGVIKGTGTDLLLNVSYFATEQILFYVKPGVQLSREENTIVGNISLSILEENEPPAALSLPINNKVINNSTSPEIILGASWRLPVTAPLYLGASYQYVWKENTSRRDFISLNLEYVL
ncbi:TPA: hypothetical protein ACG2L8_002136 [Legionella pneumophila]|nr:hypothetical protein [Legionella pneumophila]HAT2067169.1 hypothetical protein [Legionella pneumophila]HAT8593266.1 hypothetical protein [Legionella pneumophila]HAU1577390.1 hypothetical protein [Legionella pneumophila]HAU1681035.1 hypothetical protein [Legionella pneumophila]HAU3701088.1 hypothetical protein [Legionella pneumophila]